MFCLRNLISNLPVLPKKPVAWQSSTNVSALYLSAKSQILSKGATFPSIENTPSVTISLIRPFDDFNLSSKSKCLKNHYIKNVNLNELFEISVRKLLNVLPIEPCIFRC